jgi:hypothetical protein
MNYYYYRYFISMGIIIFLEDWMHRFMYYNSVPYPHI